MFRTELSIRPAAQLLAAGARVLTVGSCFSDVIGERLGQHKVETLTNPFGTVFNPLAAARLLRAVAGEDTDWQQHLVQARGRWQSFDLHATLGADSPPALLNLIEQKMRKTAEFARTADVLIWTLGTAYAYRLRDTGEVVNNCHKVPAERFEKELLTAEEIVSAVTEAYALLRQRNPKLQLVLTVSPVRHLKDTLPLNAVSKSVLRVACHYLSELLPGASYFPAYELLLDDLRDYRFYGADMLHPAEQAEHYIWEKFIGTYFDSSFKQFVQEWAGIQRALNHRPIFDGAPEHRAFLEQTQQRLQRLAGRVDVRAELRDVQQRIAALPLPLVPEPEPELNDNEERIDVGYEDAVAIPAARAEAPVAAELPKREPSWAEILSAEAEVADEDDSEEDDEAESVGSGNEAAAALPGEADKKRRKRKRGGRKHKKKGNRQAEEVDAAATEAEASDTETGNAPTETPLAAEAAGATVEAPFVEVGPALAGETESPIAEPADTEAPFAQKSKRRNRGGRKKPALYTEQSVSADMSEPVQADAVPETAPEAASIAATAVAELRPAVEPRPAETAPADTLAAEKTKTETAEAATAVSASASLEVPTVAADAATEAPATGATGPSEPAAAEAAPPKGRRIGRGGKSSRVAPALEAAAEALPQPLPAAAPTVIAEPMLDAVVEPPTSSAPVVANAAEAGAVIDSPTEPTGSDEPVGAATPAAPKKRAAPRRKPKAEAAPAAETAPEPAASVPPASPEEDAAPAAPKRRARPPRRKPEEPTDMS